MKILYFLLVASSIVSAQKNFKAKPTSFHSTQVPEPSDICLNPSKSNSFYMVSDMGYLYETNSSGEITRKAEYRGIDTEAVFAKGDKVYVIQEFNRKIAVFDAATLQLIQTKTVNYNGGRNKGYESFTFNQSNNRFVLITEKEPINLFELDENFNVVNEIDLNKIARDISSATYYNNFIWLLSDEDRTVFKLNPITYEVISKWIVPIINPEGITFDSNGKLFIVSDDRKKIYIIDNLQNE